MGFWGWMRLLWGNNFRVPVENTQFLHDEQETLDYIATQILMALRKVHKPARDSELGSVPSPPLTTDVKIDHLTYVITATLDYCIWGKGQDERCYLHIAISRPRKQGPPSDSACQCILQALKGSFIREINIPGFRARHFIWPAPSYFSQ
jgi:hypothetical protein